VNDQKLDAQELLQLRKLLDDRLTTRKRTASGKGRR